LTIKFIVNTAVFSFSCQRVSFQLSAWLVPGRKFAQGFEFVVARQYSTEAVGAQPSAIGLSEIQAES
jgi:hypothetical protein